MPPRRPRRVHVERSAAAFRRRRGQTRRMSTTVVARVEHRRSGAEMRQRALYLKGAVSSSPATKWAFVNTRPVADKPAGAPIAQAAGVAEAPSRRCGRRLETWGSRAIRDGAGPHWDVGPPVMDGTVAKKRARAWLQAARRWSTAVQGIVGFVESGMSRRQAIGARSPSGARPAAATHAIARPGRPISGPRPPDPSARRSGCRPPYGFGSRDTSSIDAEMPRSWKRDREAQDPARYGECAPPKESGTRREQRNAAPRIPTRESAPTIRP